MALTIALNKRGIVLDKGSIKTLSGVEAVAQDIQTRILLNKGENPYNMQDGIDYDTEVFGKYGGEEYLRNIYRDRIGDSPEITDVRNILFTRENGTVNVSAEVQTIYGVVNV